ncbi:hypothetical protein ACFL35_13880 [Candidatus Riflebacteria bacterium]
MRSFYYSFLFFYLSFSDSTLLKKFTFFKKIRVYKKKLTNINKDIFSARKLLRQKERVIFRALRSGKKFHTNIKDYDVSLKNHLIFLKRMKAKKLSILNGFLGVVESNNRSRAKSMRRVIKVKIQNLNKEFSGREIYWAQKRRKLEQRLLRKNKTLTQ